MLDLDLERFANGLHQTRAGWHLRMAIHEARIAVEQIGRLERRNHPYGAKMINDWRRTYIKACEKASEAIDQLWDKHQWPADGARRRDFEWKPRPSASRR
jgi:hypothetical protein